MPGDETEQATALSESDQLSQAEMAFFKELFADPEKLPLDESFVTSFAQLVGYKDITPQLVQRQTGPFTAEIEHYRYVLKRVRRALQSGEETQQLMKLASQLIASNTEQDVDEIAGRIHAALDIDTMTSTRFRQRALKNAQTLEDDATHGGRLAHQHETLPLTQIAQNPSKAYLDAMVGYLRFGAGVVRALYDLR